MTDLYLLNYMSYQVSYCHELYPGKILGVFPTFEQASFFAINFVNQLVGVWHSSSECDPYVRIDMWTFGQYWVDISRHY